MGSRSPLTLSEWRLAHELPAAVVLAAGELGRGDYVRGLEMMARRADAWPGRVARWLLEDRRELERVLGELAAGLRPAREYVEEAEAACR